MWCKEHRIEYDSFGFGDCPACRRANEEREVARQRHAELLAAQREQAAQILSAQREQARAQAAARERAERASKEASAHRQRQVTLLEESLRAQEERTRAEHERMRAEREERESERLRMRLRAGLPEFDGYYQQAWRQINERLEVACESVRLAQAQAGEWREQKALAEKDADARLASLSAEFDRRLQSGRAQAMPAGPDSDAAARDALRTAQAAARGLAGSLGVRRAGDSDGDFVSFMTLLADLTSSLTPERTPPRPVAARLTVILMSVAGIGACVLAGAAGTRGLGGVLFAAAAGGTYLALRTIDQRAIARHHATWDGARRLIVAAHELRLAVCGVTPDTQPDARLSPPQSPVDVKAWLKELRQCLVTDLADDYFARNGPDDPLHVAWRQAYSTLLAVTHRSDACERELAQAIEERDGIALRHASMSDEIARVGAQILDGVRLPGCKKVGLSECASCGAPLGDESSACGFCGRRQAHAG